MAPGTCALRAGKRRAPVEGSEESLILGRARRVRKRNLQGELGAPAGSHLSTPPAQVPALAGLPLALGQGRGSSRHT